MGPTVHLTVMPILAPDRQERIPALRSGGVVGVDAHMKQESSPALDFEGDTPLHDFYTWDGDPSGDGPVVTFFAPKP